MVVNYFKYVKLIFRFFLILFHVLVIQNLSAQISDPIVKDSISFPSISFHVDTLKAAKCTIGGDDAAFFVNDKKGRKWKVIAPPQFGMDGLQIKASPMSEIEVDSTFGKAITGLKLEPSGIVFNEPLKINLTIDDSYADSPVIFFLTDDVGNLTEIPVQQNEGNDYTFEINHFSGLVGLVPLSIENKKALNAIAEYKDQPEKFMAIGKFAITVSRYNCLLGSPNAEENSRIIFNALNTWAKNNIKYTRKKLLKNMIFSISKHCGICIKTF